MSVWQTFIGMEGKVSVVIGHTDEADQHISPSAVRWREIVINVTDSAVSFLFLPPATWQKLTWLIVGLMTPVKLIDDIWEALLISVSTSSYHHYAFKWRNKATLKKTRVLLNLACEAKCSSAPIPAPKPSPPPGTAASHVRFTALSRLVCARTNYFLRLCLPKLVLALK